MERLLLRANEAAELLGLGRAKLYMMMASGQLPTVRIGRSVRVPLDKLREWVDNQLGCPTMPDDHPGHSENLGDAVQAPTEGQTSRQTTARR